jgi:hypothetical protein
MEVWVRQLKLLLLLLLVHPREWSGGPTIPDEGGGRKSQRSHFDIGWRSQSGRRRVFRQGIIRSTLTLQHATSLDRCWSSTHPNGRRNLLDPPYPPLRLTTSHLSRIEFHRIAVVHRMVLHRRRWPTRRAWAPPRAFSLGLPVDTRRILAISIVPARVLPRATSDCDKNLRSRPLRHLQGSSIRQRRTAPEIGNSRSDNRLRLAHSVGESVGVRVVLAYARVRRGLLTGWKTDHKLACLGSFNACVDRRDSRGSRHAFSSLDNAFLHRIRAVHAVQLVIETYSQTRQHALDETRKRLGCGGVQIGKVKQKRQECFNGDPYRFPHYWSSKRQSLGQSMS